MNPPSLFLEAMALFRLSGLSRHKSVNIVFANAWRWLWLSGLIGFSQVLVQGISAVTGVVLVRALSKDDYALLTIAGSLLATITLLADGGIASAITAMSGRVMSERASMASVIRACASVRNRLSWLALVLALPPFYVLLTDNGLRADMAVMVLGLGTTALWPSTDAKLLPVPLRVLGHVPEAQMIEIIGALVRLGLTAGVLFAGLKWLLPVFAATVASIWAQACLVRRSLRRHVDLSEPALPQDTREVNGFVRSLYANHIFFCIQGQLATWIISATSGAEQIADVGALARLTAIFSIFNALQSYLVMPNLAATKSALHLRRKLVATLMAAVAAIALLVVIVWLQPRPFLWVLGAPYFHLEHELILAFTAQGIAFTNGVLWIFLQIRGWINRAWFNIPLTLAGYAVAAALFPLNTVSGVLMMTGMACVPPLVWAFSQCWIRIAAEIRSQAAAAVS